MYSIVFVCLGNICRSPMAECIFTDMLVKSGVAGKVKVCSAATSREEEGNGIYPATMRKLREEGIPILKHFATPLTRADYDRYDLFVGMETRNIDGMRRIFSGDKQGKIMRLLDCTERPRDIADPWWTGDFDRAYRDIREGCEALLAWLAAKGII